jgi:hypothetical protein
MRTSLLLTCGLALGACTTPSSTRYALNDDAPVDSAALRSSYERAAVEPLNEVPHSADLSLVAELQAPGMMDRREPRPSARSGKPRWLSGQVLMQGFLGAYELETVERNGGDLGPSDGSGESLSRLPAIGGGGQWKFAGERVDFGLEAMISFGWRANAVAFAAGGGGAVIAVDVDLFLIDLYGGPFLSVFLGERWRLYGAAGPMMHWANYDQSADDSDFNGSGSGFGTGLYARTGLEFRVRPGLMIGGGARWSDSNVDLGSELGDLEVSGLQWAFTVTTGI